MGFSCTQCGYELESQGLLSNHEIHKPKFYCEECDQAFRNDAKLAKHIEDEHTVKSKADQWNCNDCPFQANSAAELLKHLKVSSHQPSKEDIERRRTVKEVKQC